MATEPDDKGAADDKGSADAAPTTAARPGLVTTPKSLLINLGIVLALLILGMIVWKVKFDSTAEELSQARARIKQLEGAHSASAAAETSKMRATLDSNAEALMRLSALPLAWAIRAELLVGNMQRAEAYINEFSRERLVRSVLLADANGQIVLASDKSLEKQGIDTVYPAKYLEMDAPTMERDAQGAARMIVPILGMSARAGTLVVVYSDTPDAAHTK